MIQVSGGGTVDEGEMSRTRLWRGIDQPERPEANGDCFLRHRRSPPGSRPSLSSSLNPGGDTRPLPSPFFVRRERDDTSHPLVYDEEERQPDPPSSETGCVDKSKCWRQRTNGFASVACPSFTEHSRQVLTVHQTVLATGRYAGGFYF